MNPEQQARVDELFTEARELPRAEHSAFLDRRCGDDPQVRAEVESLLGHLLPEFLEDRDHLPQRVGVSTEAEHPEEIGDFKILSVLGQGGMGVVYLAEQTRPVRRRVALKLIKLGMDTREVVARFEGERQALAMMSHPHIARVYEAGTGEQGRPYFVMEYVPGIPITEHCDRHRLSTGDRLGLFLQVCEGIQHAHHKGIIHRDIKASNVLVGFEGDRAVPKIIDFGIAKATEQRLAEATVFTELGQIIGTPEYMSPEQAEMTGQDIDTRTDVYSLGVLLYELLVGAFPFDSAELRHAGFDELRRRIREDDPPTPSTRFIRLGASTEAVCFKRRTDRASFVKQLKGDLDWITMKTLEKDRTRRYSSASELAADIDRHVRDEPVLARPPSAAYRSVKFIRRHRLIVTAATLVLLAMGAGIVGTTIGLVRASNEATRANREALTSERISDYMIQVFEVPTPELSRGKTITAREILDRQSESIMQELEGEPEVRSRFMYVMGQAYIGLGLYDRALPLLLESLPLQRQAYGDDDIAVAKSLNEIGRVAMHTGKFEEALPLYTEALEITEKVYGPDHPDVATVLKNVGDVQVELGRLDEALSVHERALEIRKAEFGAGHPKVAISLAGLGKLYTRAGDHDSAISLLRQSLEIRGENYESDSRGIGYGHFFLGEGLFAAARYEEAQHELEQACAIWEKALGPEHGDQVECRELLAQATRRGAEIP